MKDFRLLVLIWTVLAGTACSASRISGTYVAHGDNFVQMLQLTQTANGQISGMLTSVTLTPNGNITSDETSLTGAVDVGQLTLNVRSGLLQFFGAGSLAGTVTGSAIQFQSVESKGNITHSVFVRSTPDQFAIYVDRLKANAARITSKLKAEAARSALNGKLLADAHDIRERVSNAEAWLTNAETHADRIPNAKATYEQIEKQMRSLIAREESQPYGSAARTQLAVAVGRGDITGGQVDLEIDQIWDVDIAEGGSGLYSDFQLGWGNCGTGELRRRGASAQAIGEWESACKQAVAERAKFLPAYRRIMQQRAELKAFQSTASANRKALIEDANELEYASAR